MSNEYEFLQLKVRKILCDEDPSSCAQNVSEIAESMALNGQIQPIVVRRLKENRKIIYEVVAGADRLRAKKLLGEARIDCLVFEGSEEKKRLVAITENLWRKNLTVLERAELLMEWLELASAHVNFSGQAVRKRKTGRRAGGIALAARHLPLFGRADEARRKIVDRAVKIASLSQEVKAAARAAALDHNQSALLRIGKAGSRKAQLKKVEELFRTTCKAKRRTSENDADRVTLVKSPPLQSAGKSTQASRESGSHSETTFEELERFWDRGGRQLWTYATTTTRDRFIEKLNRAVCKAAPEVDKFVRDVMRGRRLVAKKELAALGAKKGLSRKRVLKAAKSLYRSKKVGKRANAVWYFENSDSDWKERRRLVSNADLQHAYQSEPDRNQFRARAWDGSGRDYYDDLKDSPSDQPRSAVTRTDDEDAYADLS